MKFQRRNSRRKSRESDIFAFYHNTFLHVISIIMKHVADEENLTFVCSQKKEMLAEKVSREKRRNMNESIKNKKNCRLLLQYMYVILCCHSNEHNINKYINKHKLVSLL